MTLRIGLDAHMAGGHETGNETYVLGLIKGLSTLDQDFELEVYHAGGLKPTDNIHTRFRRLLGANSVLRLGVELPLRSLRDRVDVVHTTYNAPVWSACPVVLTIHDVSYTEHPEWFSSRDLRVLSAGIPWSIRRAARVITVSDLCRSQIINRYHVPEAKIVRVYNAAGPAGEPIEDTEARRIVSSLGINLSRKYVLAVGNLQPRKNLIRLIDAIREVNRRGLEAELVIVGPEHYQADLVRGAADRDGDHVRLTGYLTDRQLAACYACAAVFAFPSLFEGFGIPALEAMAHATPVAAARAGALPEVCGDAALYFDPLDVTSMAAALKRLLEDASLRAELAQAGKARERQFTWRHAAEETLAVYEAVVASAGVPQSEQ